MDFRVTHMARACHCRSLRSRHDDLTISVLFAAKDRSACVESELLRSVPLGC